MKRIITDKEVCENAYAHGIVGGYLFNDLWETYVYKTKFLVARCVKRGHAPERIALAKSVLVGRLVQMARRYGANHYDDHWKLEAGDTWCARLWVADDIIYRVDYQLKNAE